ncbi:pyoverdine chromophore precursor synthetase [Xenorhabdus mauleonii]|uniref:Non-ribosomal peptide synthetase component F n=1 Tax=Xenorhabdus mauleonii TaxID=351675 RepID=A0A1I3JGF9_9GAMM|nr:AMP-binding protein [Xenorhabdus mauleonii]PHM46203.1 pyoverdine chromophore precursor synthetase [Xenorhabdus mauleonii]SFI59319.1 Non-ribosomal peptide synthetase component F [Xenorhabdus mauleonii]
MFTNDPIAMNAKKQALKEYVQQQLDTEYQGCPFFVAAQSVSKTDCVTLPFPLPEKLNNRIFTMAAASPLHRLSLFSACIKYLAFLHCHEPESSLLWILGETGAAGNHPSIEGGYLVPTKWNLTENRAEQPVKTWFGDELIQWKQVAALTAGLPPKTASSALSQLPQVLVGYSETQLPFVAGGFDEEIRNKMEAGHYSLSLWCHARPEKTELHVRFNPCVVAPELIELLMERLILLLGSMVSDPAAPLASMQWITPQEQERVRALSAQQPMQPPQYQNVAQAITASIRDRADRHCLEVDEQSVSFRQLAQYTERLLLDPQLPEWASLGDCVLIVGAKGVEITLAAMACIRIGKPFCIQSNSVPERQLLDIIALQQTKTVLLQEEHSQLAAFFRQQGCRVIMLPEYQPASLAAMADISHSASLTELLRKGESVSPDAPLCAVMTSGSEGKPKGSLNTHRALLNISAEMHELYRSVGSRIASVSNHSFDYFVLECVQFLTQDIVLVIAPEDARIDAKKCVEFLREKQIDLLFTTTVFAEDIMELGDIPSLQQLYFGGENLRTLQKNNYQLFNVYGPSETGVLTTYLPIVRNDQKITIGKPFGGCQCAVVFPDTLELCPVGVQGELLIGGVGVGAGYFNRPDLTEKAFINLNTEWLTGRYYRSGDLCCWNTQGEIEILGRRDRQLKVNGFRIELDAVEKNVLDLPMVSEAAVISLEDKRQHALLGAFIVPAGPSVNEQHIRQALLGRMPAYMVPSQIVLITELPLTSTGKLDRQALKQRLGTMARDENARPIGATQEWLAACWGQHLELEVEALSVKKSFFSLGGHSLRAVKVLVDIQQHFGSQMTLPEFFKNDTIEMLAEFIDRNSAGDERDEADNFWHLLEMPAAISTDGRGVLSAQEARLYAEYRLNPESRVFELPLEIPLSDAISAEAAKQALQTLLDRHDILRSRYRIDDEGVPYAEILPSLNVEQVLFDDLQQWQQVQGQPFDLEEGPLVRGHLQNVNTQQACLQLQIHHILVDKPSLEILLREFEHVLKQIPLPPVALSYRHYATALAEARKHPIWEQAEAFWKDYMTGLEFDPFGHGAVDAGWNMGLMSWDLSAEDKVAVQQLCYTLNITPAMFFLSVWGLTVAREGCSDVFSISVANALRPKHALDTVGMFVSLFPCAFRFDKPAGSFEQLVKQLTDEQWQSAEHLFYPVEEAFSLLSSDPRVFGSNPLLNVSYVYMDVADEMGTGIYAELDKEDLAKEVHGPLNLSVIHSEHSCRLVLESQSDVFSEPQLAAMANSYQAILQQILHHSPSALQVNTLIAPGAEEQQAFRPVQRRASYTPINAMLLAAFRTLGERPAVIDNEDIVTWEEFAELTASYAQMLNTASIRKALILGWAGSQMQAFLAACLLTHTTYLALEIETPEERIKEVIHHAEPDLVVNMDISAGAGTVAMDWRDFHSAKSCEDNPIAWILYSSGTTGRPKGICVTANTAAQYVDSLINRLSLNEALQANQSQAHAQQGVRVVQQFSPSFDGHIEEILLAWALQGTSVIADRYSLLDERKANEFLRRYRPDVISAAPALFSAWNRMPDLGPLPKVCISGGDFLVAGDIDQLLDKTQIWNSYGPTETCIAVSMVDCARLASDTALSIGTPFEHVAFAIVDKNGIRLRAGQWGELVIYGDFEHHGYLKDPILTASKFGQDEQGFFFRTGDLVMADKSGLFYLKGRMDDSCKVRGNFIGLGELENRARQYSGVIAAGAAVAFAGTPEACLVLAIEGESNAGQEHIQSGLQQYLARHYPRSHLPSALFSVESLPRTDVGKMDRQQIVALFHQWLESEQQIQGEQDPAADENLQKLMDCWRKCLGYKGALTLNSDFFLISGSSLSAVRLASQLETLFDVMFSPVDVFRHATLGEQWSLIQSRQGHVSNPAVAPDAQMEERCLNMDAPALPKLLLLPPALGGLVELQALANNLAGRVTVSVLTVQPAVTEDMSESAFKAMLLSTLASHLKAQENSSSRPLWLGGYSLGAEMLAALLSQMSLAQDDLLKRIDKLVFFDPNLKTDVFDGDVLYADFMQAFRDMNHQAGISREIGADIDAGALRQASPALYQEWHHYWLQHQLLESQTFYERVLALSLNSIPVIPVEMFFSDDADAESIAGLTQQLEERRSAHCAVHRCRGSHAEFIKQLSPDNFM